MAPRKVRSFYRVRRGLSKNLGRAAIVVLLTTQLPAIIGGIFGIPWLQGVGVGVVGVGLLSAPLFALAAPIAAFVQSRAPAIVDVENGDLVFVQGERRRRIPRDKIESGVVVPSTKNPLLEIYLKDGDVMRIAIDDVAAGSALLDELGVGALKRRVRIELADDSRKLLLMIPRLVVTIFLWLMLLGMGLNIYQSFAGHSLPFMFFGPWVACIVGTLLLWQRLARPESIEVGTDGVTIHRALRDRFISHASTAAVWAHGKQVFFREHSGTVTSAGGSMAQAGAEPGAHAAPTALAAVHRIEQARRGKTGEQIPEEAAAQLDRDDQSVQSWRRELQDVMAPDAGYRSTALSADDVERVLADPYAPIDRRIGAAVALKAAGLPGAPEKIRVAAEATSNDELRNALEQVADARGHREAEDEAIAEAMLATEKKAEKHS